MKRIEEIKAMIRGMIAKEMEYFKEAVANGEEDITMSPGIYTMLQVLLARIEEMPPVWHDVSEKPEYIEDDTTHNTIAVAGMTSVGIGMSVATMTEENEIFVPLTKKSYSWGDCPFTKWAYITDLIPDGLIKEE